jgi:hypothetical protein
VSALERAATAFEEDSMDSAQADDALRAYDIGRADGVAGRQDELLAENPWTGADYRVGVVDGQVAVFEENLIAAIRRALDDKN